MKSSKSGLFLMELIISILFFSITSAVCIQLFVKAHLLDVRTMEQNQAVVWFQNLSSLWLSYEGDMSAVYNRLHADYDADNRGYVYLSNDGETVVLYFDKDWQPAVSDIAYTVILQHAGYDSSTQLLNADISITKGEETLFELPLVKHPAAERGNSHE